jgi:anti-sigma B factor antagonist
VALTIASNGRGDSLPQSSTVVVVRGEIDLATSPQLRQALSEAIDGGSMDVVVDLAEVGFIDATGVGALIAAVNQAQRVGRRLTLRAPSHAVRRVLEIVRLEPELPIVD